MKPFLMGLLPVLLGSMMVACGGLVPDAPEASPSTTTVPVAPASPSVAALKLGSFTIDEIYDIGAAGCGMTLWTAEENQKPPADRTFTLLSGLEEDTTLMKINGEIIGFHRTAASGDSFYGQFTSQTFVNEEHGISVQVDVELGKQGEIESVSIPAGTIGVEMDGENLEIPVIGDAGC